MSTQPDFNKLLFNERLAQHLTLADIERRSGLDHKTIYKLESLSWTNCSIKALLCYLEALNLKLKAEPIGASL